MVGIRLIAFLAASLCVLPAVSQDDGFNCFAIVAGRNATTDGSVLFAHNEDDSGEQMFNGWVVPRTENHCKYLWCEMAGLAVADSYLNEYGVAISSDNCPSREDAPSLTDGGILADLRRIVGQTAKSSKDAVRIIGELVETRGYNQPGRTYVVADANEAWAVSVVYGRHWVAKRVADDEVMILPNCYTIDEVDLSDSANYRGCADLLSYAQKRGWWDPAKEKFSFRKAYGKPSTFKTDHNTQRFHSAYCQIVGKEQGTAFESYHFSVKPAKKISKEFLMSVMRSHGNFKPGTSFESHPSSISLCGNATVISTIMSLRSWLPKEIGSVMWLAIGHPCTEVYIPWHLGMTKAPEGYQRYDDAETAIKNHLLDKTDKRKNFPQVASWKIQSRWEDINKDYVSLHGKASKSALKNQERIIKSNEKLEKSLSDLYDPSSKQIKDINKLEQMLNEHTSGLYSKYLNY